MFSSLLFALGSACIWVSSANAFGLTVSGSNFVVDTGAGLIFTVNSATADITSMLFNGIQAQDSSKFSQISSGIDAPCTWVQGGNSNNYITITCTTSTLVQYYVARYNDPAIHMATYTTAEPASVGELRFIARLKSSTIPNGVAVASIVGGTAIEASDVYLVGGQTRSKFYSSRQFIDDSVHSVGGSGISVSMIVPGTGFESSSGGPFFRDIDNQGTAQQEFYFYMNSGHVQTEAFRQGLHGPYALWFTTGATPATFDTSFWEGLTNIKGLVPVSGRGRLTGKASGFPSGDAASIVVGWSNSVAQYWVRADTSGNYVSPYMKPGTYTMTLYRVELAIASQTVLITAGTTGTCNIASTEAVPTTIWQIGTYDGTPRGFLNADNIETMHPSDTRMSSWGPITYAVGASAGTFPMALFKDIGPVTITFTLTSAQIGARTLQVAITHSFGGGRPQVVVNSWTGPAPAAPVEIDSRAVTRGSWRGNNAIYAVSIPSGTLVVGSNKIVITVISGSTPGTEFLSPSIQFDTIRLI